jgi:hypothetical protein
MRKLEQLYFKSLEFSDQRLDLLGQSSSQRMPPSAGASTADAAARVRQRNTAVYYSVIACDQVAGQNNITRIVTGEVEMARGRVGIERCSVQALTCAAGAEASHRLHELANVTGVTSRRIGGETAELCAPTRRWLTTGPDLRF